MKTLDFLAKQLSVEQSFEMITHNEIETVLVERRGRSR
jgi:hypothetical protein